MAYFETKSGSLEESIRKAVSGIQEKIEYVEYKFKNRNDAMKAKKMLDAVQLMDFEINDDNIRGGELMVDAGNRDMTKYHQEIIKKFRPKVMTTEKLVGGQKKLDKDKDGDLDAKDFALLRKDAKKKKDESLDEGKMKQGKSLIDDIAKEMRKNRMMKGFADKFVKDAQKTLDPRKSLEKVLPDYVPGKDIAKLLNMGEGVKLDEIVPAVVTALNASVKASTAYDFDRLIQTGGVDKADFRKAKNLYTQNKLMDLRKHIYNLDTDPLESIMDVISKNDPKAFMKMYPKSKKGEYMSSIAYAHKEEKELTGENFEMGTPENTKSKLDATPGQSSDDWQEQVDTMQKKNASMREALAKVWGVGEGHNPFKEDEHSPDEKKKKVKIDTKTMTGKPITKVEVDPDMREVKVGKKNVR